jgi:release factor glutamine methyltransferase
VSEAGSPTTIGEVRRRAINKLRGAFGDDPRSAVAGLDARLIVAHVLGCEPGELITREESPVPADIEQAIVNLVARRAAGTPVARLTGHKEFYGLDLIVSHETLVPRPDTESVVDAALALVDARGWRKRAIRVLDLGTGAGGLLLALLSELSRADGIGADISADALATAGRNAKRHGLETRARFVASDWAGAIEGTFDLVVSNPPYIRSGDLAGLDDEVRLHDPAAALDGGTDGLVAYRAILGDLPRLLVPGGAAFLEIGHDQAFSVREAAEVEGFKVTLTKDLAGRDRVVGLSLV